MKKGFIFSFFILATYFLQAQLPNPASQYCELLGYSRILKVDSFGNEIGYCILPNGDEVEEWAFFRGKAGTQYSYCAQKGYSLILENRTMGDFTYECPVCVHGKQKVLMTDLMIRNREVGFGSTLQYDTTPVAQLKLPENKSTATFPSSFDWRSYNGNNYINPVKNQGSCGSCYAFAAASSAEGVFNIATHRYNSSQARFSESFIIWCLSSINNNSSHFYGCNGADYEYAELKALATVGICYESAMPYTLTNPNSCNWSTTRFKVNNWKRISCLDINTMKSAIINYGPIVVRVYVSAGFQNYPNGYPNSIYSDALTNCPNNESTAVNHAITIVGWGTDPQYGEYWIVRNSWGAGWGLSGYMKIKMTSARIGCSPAILYPNNSIDWKPIDCHTTSVTNQTIATNNTTIDCMINVSNVTIQNNANVIFDHSFMTSITGPFEVKRGCTLEIR
jgi:C1A family cysteine protease/putative hemolysin